MTESTQISNIIYRAIIKLITAIAIASALIASPSSLAALAPKYQFDLIIYQQINPQSLSSESWPELNANIMQPNPNNITLFAPLTGDPTLIPAATSNIATTSRDNSAINQSNNPETPSLQLADNSKYIINERQLRRLSSKHPIVLHISWIETSKKLASGSSLNIIGGSNLNSSTESNSKSQQLLTNNQTQTATATSNTINLNTISNAIYQVKGTISIKLRRYFNVKTNLIFTAASDDLKKILPSWDKNNNLGKWSYFQLMQNRRMRSNELNYIDFPLYGVLLTIKPIENQS